MQLKINSGIKDELILLNIRNHLRHDQDVSAESVCLKSKNLNLVSQDMKLVLTPPLHVQEEKLRVLVKLIGNA